MIRRPAAYKAAALPAELRQRYRNPPRLSGCRVPEKPARQRRKNRSVFSGERAIDRIRTGDLRITRALLCQLSYDGEKPFRHEERRMGHASKGFLILRPVHAADRRLLPFGNPVFSHVATGPIVLRRDSNPHYSKKKQSILPLKDEAVLRIRCWRSGSVQATEVQACALTIVPLRPNMAAGGWWR